MLAVRLKGAYKLEISEEPIPNFAADEVLLKIETVGICLHSLDLAHVETTQTVAVLGAGPIGLCTIYLLRQTKGPALIIASDILPHRVNFARTFGADAAFNAKTTGITEKVQELTNGRGVDVVFEAARSVAWIIMGGYNCMQDYGLSYWDNKWNHCCPK